jgi:sulfatase maturation enzyme AslB (radical SAM superfamily)
MGRSPEAVPPLDLAAIGLVLTADCNLGCRYCYQGRRRPATMRWPVVRAGLDLLLGACGGGPCDVSLLGGEPLLQYPMIRRAMAYLARRAPGGRTVVSMATNGTLLDVARARFLLGRGVHVALSFDGVPAAQDHRAPGSHRHLDRLLRALRDRLPDRFRDQLSVTVVCHPAGLESLADSVDYLSDVGVPRVDITPAMGTWAWPLSDIERLDRQFARIFDVSARHFASTGRVPVTLFRKTGPDLVRPIGEWGCGVCTSRSLVVDVDGQVYPCAMLARSCQTVAPPPMGRRLGRLSLGHVAAPGLAGRVAGLPAVARRLEIFARQDRKWSSYGACDDCPSVGACAVCPVAARKDRRISDPLQVPDFLCAFNRVGLDYRRRFPEQAAPARPAA